MANGFLHRWAPCIIEYILTTRFAHVSIAREIGNLLRRLPQVESEGQALHVFVRLVVSSARGDDGPFDICRYNTVRGYDVVYHRLRCGIKTIEEAKEKIEHACTQLFRRPTLAVFTVVDRCIVPPVDGFVVSYSGEQITEAAAYEHRVPEDGDSDINGWTVLHQLSKQVLWKYYNKRYTEKLLGHSFQIMKCDDNESIYEILK